MSQAIIDAIHSLATTQAQHDPLCAYIYDLTQLKQHAKTMKQALPGNVELFYAAKANPDAQLLSALAPYVDGFESASGGELDWLVAQQHNKPLIFGGPGKLPSELRKAIDYGVESIHVESLTELRRIAALASEQEAKVSILLRMNIPLDGITTTKLTMGGKPTPFGLDPCELDSAMAILRDYPQVHLQGFHFHLMSHQLCVEKHLALMALYFETVKAWQQQYQLPGMMINLGGGVGINYVDPENHFDWPLFCQQLHQLIDDHDMQHHRLRFECGRYVTAQCGYYVMEVIDIKKNHGELFAIGRGGTHHFRTPPAQGHDHPFFVVEGNAPGEGIEVNNQPVTLVGQLCTPKDVLARQQQIKRLRIGDYLVFTLAGAYGWNISHQNFLMHQAPTVHYIECNT